MPFCASSESSGESAHFHRLTLAFATVQNLMISYAALNGDLCAIHASSEYSGESVHLRRHSHLDNAISIKIYFACSVGSGESAPLHRLA